MPRLCHCFIGEKERTFDKLYGIEFGDIGNNLGEHIGQLKEHH